MKTYVFKTAIWLPYPRETVFDFFNKAENLQQITPPSLSFEILTPSPIVMKKGALIDYKLRLKGIPMRWKTEITEWQPPYRFVDTQLKGPYRKWVHTHDFEEKDGGTQMYDRVEYALPGGVFASIINRLFVRQSVKEIFDYRQKKIREIFPSTTQAEKLTF